MARSTIAVNIADLPEVKALMTAARERIKTLEAALQAVAKLAEDDEKVAAITRIYAAEAKSSELRDYWELLTGVREQSAARIRTAMTPARTPAAAHTDGAEEPR